MLFFSLQKMNCSARLSGKLTLLVLFVLCQSLCADKADGGRAGHPAVQHHPAAGSEHNEVLSNNSARARTNPPLYSQKERNTSLELCQSFCNDFNAPNGSFMIFFFLVSLFCSTFHLVDSGWSLLCFIVAEQLSRALLLLNRPRV